MLEETGGAKSLEAGELARETKRYSRDIVDGLKRACPEVDIKYIESTRYVDEDTILVPAHEVLKVAGKLKDNFPFLADVCGVDYPDREKRFDVVYHFSNPEKNERLRVKAMVGEFESLPSVTSVYKAANWFEREAFDMFGVKFDGHPNLRRILCHEDFVGYPLRKDYPADKNQPLLTPIAHTFEKDRERMMAEEEDHLSDRVWINIGPAHPATHGTLRFMAVLSGETIEKVDVEIGYLHRCFEKMCETHNYNQIIPYTDRLNYLSSPLNNNAWCRTIEKMLGVDVPPRAKIIRVILDEFSRIMDHLVCNSIQGVDLGALTNLWLGFSAREAIYDLLEKLSGARLTVSIARVGGLGFDLPKDFVKQAREVLKVVKKSHYDLTKLLVTNRIFLNRTVNIGKIDAKSAMNWGFAGPCLRATGVPRDLRVDAPYSGYENFQFDIPVGHRGDVYDRFMVRMDEILESCKIIEQALDNIPEGPISVNDPTIRLPAKEDVYGNIEGLMNQFMLVIHGVKVPRQEIYCASEGGNGELGFYVVSDGSGTPYRVKCRPPCFAVFQAFPEMVEGQLIADAVATLSSINIIAGELDR
jgi:NADH-quinone oxidoreductase subunit C/D